jgi:hypothetical protein
VTGAPPARAKDLVAGQVLVVAGEHCRAATGADPVVGGQPKTTRWPPATAQPLPRWQAGREELLAGSQGRFGRGEPSRHARALVVAAFGPARKPCRTLAEHAGQATPRRPGSTRWPGRSGTSTPSAATWSSAWPTRPGCWSSTRPGSSGRAPPRSGWVARTPARRQGRPARGGGSLVDATGAGDGVIDRQRYLPQGGWPTPGAAGPPASRPAPVGDQARAGPPDAGTRRRQQARARAGHYRRQAAQQP